MRHLVPVILLFLAGCSGQRPEKETSAAPETPERNWVEIERTTKAHLRGLDLASDGTLWASGTQGTVLKSTDNGISWTSTQIPDCESLDFRDVEGFDRMHAVVMSSGNGVRSYFTADGGLSWQMSYEDTNSGVFFDGMDFHRGRGLAYGDPQEGALEMLHSTDSGKSWIRGIDGMPKTLEGEAGFAASGTGIVLGKTAIWIATSGGSEARVFRIGADSTWSTVHAPLQSASSSGIFSMAFMDDTRGIIVGGDYVDSTRNTLNGAYTNDGGLTWAKSNTNPGGYRSCVFFDPRGTAVCTGRSGTDISNDFGRTWQPLSDNGYFSCVISDDWLIGVGRSGKIGRLQLKTKD